MILFASKAVLAVTSFALFLACCAGNQALASKSDSDLPSAPVVDTYDSGTKTAYISKSESSPQDVETNNDTSILTGTLYTQSVNNPGESSEHKFNSNLFALPTRQLSPAMTSEPPTNVKELNFVFLHGMGGTPCALQLLADHIHEQLPTFALGYQQDNPDTAVLVNTLMRCYPGYVDIGTWAMNIADGINTHFQDKDNLILVGHSMGGKAALFAVANNIGNLATKVSLVVTINSPIRSLDEYYAPGGVPAVDYCRIGLLGSDEGVCSSVSYYDSSNDGAFVSIASHWLAFVSSEPIPMSKKFDRAGVDAWPRNLDDGTVPLPAQFSSAADVIYYGEYGHSDLATQDDVANFIANQILRYIFGDPVECSVFARGGTFEHKADWLLGTDYWNEVIGEVVASSGIIQHTNESYITWQEWEDVVGYCPESRKRSSSLLKRLSFPFLTSIQQANWVDPDNVYDCRLYVKSRAAPRNSVQVGWTIYSRGLLPEGEERAFYDVEIVDGTPLTSIKHVSWADDDPRDIRLWIYSEAQSPFRWFNAEWRIYQKVTRYRKVIDEIPEKILSASD